MAGEMDAQTVYVGVAMKVVKWEILKEYLTDLQLDISEDNTKVADLALHSELMKASCLASCLAQK